MPQAGFREKVDMAVFASVPGFVRVSIRLDAIDPVSAARPAAALLARAGASARRSAVDDPHLMAWREAYARVGLPEDTVPPPELLAAWALAPGGVPSQGALADLVHAFSLQHRVPIAAYDARAVQGDLWLRPSRGCEHFLAIGLDRPSSPDLNELVLVDSGEQVFARCWHGRQGRPALAGPAAREVLIHLDLLPPLTEDAEQLAGAFVRLVTGFLGGRAALQWLAWDTPGIHWPPDPRAI